MPCKVDVPILWVIHTNKCGMVSNYWVNVLYLMRFIIQIIVTTSYLLYFHVSLCLVGSKKRFPFLMYHLIKVYTLWHIYLL